MAKEIIGRFHSELEAEKAQQAFVARFQQGQMPEDIPIHHVDLNQEPLTLTQLLKSIGLVSSTSEAMRMIKQGAAKVDGQKIESPDRALENQGEAVFQVGKRRFARVVFGPQNK